MAASSRTVTSPMIRSIGAVATGVSTDYAAAKGAANSAATTSGTISLPCRADVRQEDRWLAFTGPDIRVMWLIDRQASYRPPWLLPISTRIISSLRAKTTRLSCFSRMKARAFAPMARASVR